MSDHSDKSVQTSNNFLSTGNLTKVAGGTLLLGLTVSVGYYLYSNYYKESNKESNKENSVNDSVESEDV